MKLGMMRGRVLPMGSAMFGALLTTAALSGCVVRGPGGGGYQQPQSSGGAGSSYNQSSGSNYNQGSSSNYGGATSQPSSQNDAAWVSNAINSINRGLNDPANQQAYALDREEPEAGRRAGCSAGRHHGHGRCHPPR